MWRYNRYDELYISYKPIICITKKILRNKSKNTSIYKNPSESFRFHFREYEVMAPFSRNPFTFYGGSKSYDTWPLSLVILLQKSLSLFLTYRNQIPKWSHLFTQNDRLTEKRCQSDLIICLDRRGPTLLIHTEIMTSFKSRRVYYCWSSECTISLHTVRLLNRTCDNQPSSLPLPSNQS